MTVTASNFGSGGGNTGTGNNTGGGYSGSSSGGHSGRPGGGSSSAASAFTNRDCWVGGAGHGTCPPNSDTQGGSSDQSSNQDADSDGNADDYRRPTVSEVVDSLAEQAVQQGPISVNGRILSQGVTAGLRPPVEDPCDNAEFRDLHPDLCAGGGSGNYW